MTATPDPTTPMLTVIEGGRGRPSSARLAVLQEQADEARMELAARRSEEQAFATAAEPLLRRLELMAREVGPAAWQTVAALASLHGRHAQRWADPDGRAA